MPIILLTALLAAFSGGSDAAPCSSKLPLIPAAGGQSVNVEALMNLSDIGSNGADAEPPFSVSPDGGLIAFVLRHADPSGNRYCSSLLVVDATSGAVRKSVTVPGGPLPMLLDSDGMEGLLGGPIKATIPLWSPNGSIIALQTEIAGNSQIEALAVDTGKWDQLTTSRMDVRDFSWSADGNSILFTARPETASAWSAIAQESVTGYHFDERWAPERADHPFPKPSPTRLFEINVATRTIRDAQSGRSDQSDRRPAEVHDLVGLRPTVVTIA